MIQFKQSTTIKGTCKGICVTDGRFVDIESGDILDLAQLIENYVGPSVPFDLTITQKSDEALDELS